MKELYHESHSKFKQHILSEGIKPQTQKSYSDKYHETKEYYIIENVKADFMNKAFPVLNKLIDRKRPDKYPPRNKCVFLHSSKSTIVGGKQKPVFRVDLTKENNLYPMYQVEYNIVEKIFFNSMRSWYKKDSKIKKEPLNSQIKKYWKNIEKVNNRNEIKDNMEVFTQKRIPVEMIELIDQNK